jgi:phosphoglycolate phosphatase
MKFDVDCIVFDLDGTLIDSKTDIANSVNHTLHELGISPLPHDLIFDHVGHGVIHLIDESLKVSRSTNHLEEALAIFRAHYYDHLMDTTVLFPQVFETVDYFYPAKRMAVASNKPQRYVEKLLKELKVDRYFTSVYGGDRLPEKKPDPAVIFEILKETGAVPGRAIIVGDSWIDITTGKNAGIYTCGVSYGFRALREILDAGPDVIIDRMGELKDLLH